MSKASVDQEIKNLVENIKKSGTKGKDGKITVKFGTLFQEDTSPVTFDSIAATLRTAREKNIVSYDGDVVLQGQHDDLDITLLQ